MNEGIHVQAAQSCLLCGSEGILLYQDLRDRLFGAIGTWTLLRCPKCGLVWLNPRPILNDIGKLYSKYHTHDIGDEISKKRLKSLRKAVKFSILNSAFGYWNDGANRTLGWLTSRLGPLRDIVGGSVMWLNGERPGRLLDVGCGNGRFLDTMHELGWEVVGVEPDAQAVKIAQDQFGLNVYEGLLEEVGFPDDTFDAVTMNHVVEHLHDPISTLRECQRVLKKSGQLVMVTPNIESLGHRLYRVAWRGLEVPRHLFLFSPRTLRVCVERSGLQVIELRTTARSARWMWVASNLIRRKGTLPGGSPKEPGLRLRLEGLAFQAVEYGLCMVRDTGEDIVMMASKGAKA